ncbi:MAG: DUF882 domain-containing protein [Nannocystaceae bacterium]|nr:DUF882 domain-containing protein [Nannocystaceae bacterium]
MFALTLGLLATLSHPAAATSKKTKFLAAKAQFGTEQPPPPRETTKVVYARNLHTHEVMPLEGPGLSADARDRFLRCWFTEESPDAIPPALVERILAAAHNFESRHVRIVSGFRHPKYNKLLRKKGREVARKSQHTLGHAIDFSLAGVPVRELYPWLLRTHKGGVGVYRRSGFVHIDTGRKRTWSGR